MIVVDTSIWIAALRSRSTSEAETLGQLIDADEVGLPIPVRIELLSGASTADRVRLRRVLSALPVLYPTDDTWRLVDGWIDVAGKSNDRFGFADLLIGALAKEARALVWSRDTDFARMARLGLIELYLP
jgi:predicted nucleic acid-binding protein